MLQKIEKMIVGMLFGAIPVVVCFLGGWWLSYIFLPEALIGPCALGGLLLGMLFATLLLKGGIQPIYATKPVFWMAVYVFYSMCTFGFFMGVPVFNLILALPAGFIVGGWLARTGADLSRAKKFARSTSVFTTTILFTVCAASAAIALSDASTGANLAGMFDLSFTVTPAMIVGLIITGGLTILVMQWWLAKKSVEISYNLFLRQAACS
jgi:hypothetical protein